MFEHLISAIIVRKDIIEKENELRKRDSVFLTRDSLSTWPDQAGDVAQEKPQRSGSWACC